MAFRTRSFSLMMVLGPVPLSRPERWEQIYCSGYVCMHIDMLSVYAMYVCMYMSGKCGRLVVLDRAPAASISRRSYLPDLSRGSLEQDTDLNEVLEKWATCTCHYIQVETNEYHRPRRSCVIPVFAISPHMNTPIHTYIYDISSLDSTPLRHILLPIHHPT